MRIVIDIPEDILKRTVFYREFRDLNDCVTVIKALEKAILLPKGHGDLVDRKQALRTDCFGDGHDGLRAFHEYEDYAKMRKYLQNIPTIIPADDSDDCQN